MIIEIGHFALILAFLLALMQSVLPAIGAKTGRESWIQLGRKSSISLLSLCTISFFALTHAYVLSDFSVVNVVQNSHTLKPLLYKFTGVWANHEGSMLLWALVLSYWTCRLAMTQQKIPHDLRGTTLSLQAILMVGFFGFILFTSNPFLRVNPPLEEGLDLNPLLQDPLLALHPPLLYMGYVGFSVTFSLAVAGLIRGRIDSEWARICLPWIRAAWAFLTAGIALGAFWAYYELGWGGFWFWDPVENASLMPWLTGTALLHSAAVLEKKNKLAGWTVFLAILTFSLSLLGTFLVRSGVLTSVHAFAVDPERGLYILAFLGLVTGGALTIFALRAPLLPATQSLEKFSREAGLLVNNIFLFAFTVTVFIGTLYPLFYTVIKGQDLSVGPPYFNGVLLPLLVPFILLMSCGPYLVWSHRAPTSMLRHLSPPLAFAVALGICGFFMAQWPVAASIGIGTGVFLALATINHALRHRHAATIRYFAMIFAHFGLALVIIGMTCTTLLKSESIRWMQPGDQEKISSYNITFERYEAALGPNYNIDRVTMTLQNNKSETVTQLQPEKRWYPVAEKMTTETGMYMTPWGGMIYAVQGEQDSKNQQRWVIRIYHHPLVIFILLGAGMMALGGLLPFARRSLS